MSSKKKKESIPLQLKRLMMSHDTISVLCGRATSGVDLLRLVRSEEYRKEQDERILSYYRDLRKYLNPTLPQSADYSESAETDVSAAATPLHTTRITRSSRAKRDSGAGSTVEKI